MNTLTTRLWHNWRRCHDFAAFFTDCAVPERAREYDDLFKGTNVAIYIPLWASACGGRGDRLMNETTLDVIKTYHAWGYTPISLDGNPPDFIGEQFHFLCYLFAALLHDLDYGLTTTALYEQAITRFIHSWLFDTATSVADGIRRFAHAPEFLGLADELTRFTHQLAEPNAECPPDTEKARPSMLYAFEVYQRGRFPPIPDKAARVINTACINNCGGTCVLRVREQEGCILGFAYDGAPGGAGLRPCARGRAYLDTYMSGKRLRYPMQRDSARGEGHFRRISWETAAECTADAWVRSRDIWGPSSRYVSYGWGISAAMRPAGLAQRLLNLDGGHLAYYNSYSTACINFTMPYIYGDNLTGNDLEDVLNAALIILWGHNPSETVFGSERRYYLAKVKEKNIPVIVIDPRQSDTALGNEWIGVRPSSDAALAAAMAYVIWSEGLQDQHFMDTYCLGFDEAHMPSGVPYGESYETWLFGKKDGIPKTPEWAEPLTGVSAETTRRLARRYAMAKPACLMQGFGPQRTANGEQTVRAIALLTCLTGNVGKCGGSAGGEGGRLGPVYAGYPVPPNPFPGKIPCFLWTKALEQGTTLTPEADGLTGVKQLPCSVKMILNFAGNPLNQHSDINHTVELLKDADKCEFFLVSDVFMTATARFADILLPAASPLETENLALP